eukprot:2373542-Amphidinium_carterae.1
MKSPKHYLRNSLRSHSQGRPYLQTPLVFTHTCFCQSLDIGSSLQQQLSSRLVLDSTKDLKMSSRD